jgi:acetyl/propionyl-CoA carboxylase alpha subunit
MFSKLLIANRGEIAVRLLRAAREMGIVVVAVHAADDAQALHVQLADEAVALQRSGPAAYLDIPALVDAARRTGCEAVHPGYGFLSERAGFAQACVEAGLVFVGPTPAQLALFGDKAQARALAQREGVPVLPGTGAATLAEVQAFMAAQRERDPQAGVMLKAVGGGGGRGMRAVHEPATLPEAFERCRSEAAAAFGIGEVLAERLMHRARHIELQVLGDGVQVVSLGERECTLQRRYQKLVEVAPSPSLPAALRPRLEEAALRLARAVGYRSLGTFEFLVDEASPDLPFVFIEANPRLQVEHTVTEEVTGVDLVQAQIAVAAGATLPSLGLAQPPAPRGFAVQWRINAETLDAAGAARPSSGRIARLDWPTGPGLRIDTDATAGTAPSPHYDTLLAKLIVSHRSPRFEAVLRRSQRALAECRIEGLDTNLPLLRALAHEPEVARQALHTRWLEQQWPRLQALLAPWQDGAGAPSTPAGAGRARPADVPEGMLGVVAPMACRLVALQVQAGDLVAAQQTLAVVEAMKMEHLLHAPRAAWVQQVLAGPGESIAEGHVLLVLQPVEGALAAREEAEAADPRQLRADLQRVRDRQALTQDAARPDAVARRHASGGRTARENIADLVDDGSFIEYGALAIAAQARRRDRDDLIRNTPADGLVTGIGSVNTASFGADRSRCIVMAYDYTVLAGTQGIRNHQKTDRMLKLAHELQRPVVLFAEGGGGRPGDTDMPIVAGLNNHTFSGFAALSGQVPVLGIVHGRCFAGNAALLGCCDTIIATRHSNIGMGGPAMIEGGGLGRFAPEEIGPSAVQHRNGVIDLLVDDEAQAVAAAKQYLSYFQGAVADWQAADPLQLRQAVPENRLRVYDVRGLMQGLFDTGSVLELRAGFGAGIVTALARLEGRPVGVMASNPQHLGGAIDAEAADKAARFMQLCNAHGLPIVSLCDTPGFMVGPETERQAQVRHVCRMFVAAAHLTVPFFAVVLRKGYGLGAQAMTAGGFDAPVFTVAWPTGEFGAMGLEGAVRLGFRKELEAVPAGPGREALFRRLVDQQYEAGSALNMATTLEIDAVIDPADTRAWLLRGLQAGGHRAAAARRFIDTW